MTLADSRTSGAGDFAIEDLTTGPFASGFGRVGDGRSFSFHVHRGQLVVEIYRPRLTAPVPQPEDVMAVGRRELTGLDLDDARSLSAAVRDTVAAAEPLPRPPR